MKPGYYSPHFSRLEMVASESAARYGIDNTCPPTLETNLVRLCNDFLEPIRLRWGAMRITSGYRCAKLNGLIGGSGTSAHMEARAADTQYLEHGVTLKQVAEWIIYETKIPFDQVIYEYGSWLHIGIAAAGHAPRREALMIFHGGGYQTFNPKDARVFA